MEQLLLTAQIDLEDGVYFARVVELGLEGSGDSTVHAQDELVIAVRAWIQAQDKASCLEQALAEAGFPGADEETEIQLEFAGRSAVEPG